MSIKANPIGFEVTAAVGIDIDSLRSVLASNHAMVGKGRIHVMALSQLCEVCRCNCVCEARNEKSPALSSGSVPISGLLQLLERSWLVKASIKSCASAARVNRLALLAQSAAARPGVPSVVAVETRRLLKERGNHCVAVAVFGDSEPLHQLVVRARGRWRARTLEAGSWK